MHPLKLVLPFVVTLVACGSKVPSVPLPAASEFPPAGQPAKIVVGTPGTAPVALRFKAEKGARDVAAMKMDLTVAAKAGGESMDMSMGMSSDLEVTVDDVRADGSFVLKSVSSKTQLTLGGQLGKMAAGQESTIAEAVNGQVTTVTQDAQGRALALEMPAENPLMKQMAGGLDSAMKGSAVMFPDAPVGVGATWQALAFVDLMGGKVRMVSDYKLVELSGRKGKVELTMRGAVGAGESMGLPNGGGTINALSFTGNGNITFDLDRPSASAAQIDMKVDADIRAQGQDATMSMSMKLGMAPKG